DRVQLERAGTLPLQFHSREGLSGHASHVLYLGSERNHGQLCGGPDLRDHRPQSKVRIGSWSFPLRRSTESGLRFNLKRFYNFVRLMLSNRMAAVGLAMLLISTGAALAAPIAYPRNPQTVSSGGFFAQPQWMLSFPEGYYLSGNLVVVNDPVFTSSSALQEWSYGYSTAQDPYLSISRSSISPTTISSGSLQISSSSSSGLNVTVSKTFHYPYRGAPTKFFLPSVSVEAHGASPIQPLQVKLFISRGAERSFTLWSANLTQSDVWIQPSYILDSGVPSLQVPAGVRAGGRLQDRLHRRGPDALYGYDAGTSSLAAATGTHRGSGAQHSQHNHIDRIPGLDGVRQSNSLPGSEPEGEALHRSRKSRRGR